MELKNLDYIADVLMETVDHEPLVKVQGRVQEVLGTVIRATAPDVEIGEVCYLRDSRTRTELKAEVVGLSSEGAILSPLGDTKGISSGTGVFPTGHGNGIYVGPGLLGKVLTGGDSPSEPTGPTPGYEYRPIHADPPDPLNRNKIERHLVTGVKTIDGLLTVGEGQRLGIFAAPGVGKSTTLSMLARGADADIVVLALIGERGREVREFMEDSLGEEMMSKAVVVVATSDRPAMERVNAAYKATTIAEYFRDQGKRVLLLMDSVTRFARAVREIGLSAGEPPTRRGFPPSVFSALPKLVERAGQGSRGFITAFYTVLVEGDDMTEPVADETMSLLDGHIILSRKIAQKGIYPAIDVLASVSRIMDNLVPQEHVLAARRFRELLAKYHEVEFLMNIGEYQEGSSPVADEAIAKREPMESLLKQDREAFADFDDTLYQLRATVE